MFDDLIDPDPPRPGLDTLANISERARRLRRRRDATRVMGLGLVAVVVVGGLAFVVDRDPDATAPSQSVDSFPSTVAATSTTGPTTDNSSAGTTPPVAADLTVSSTDAAVTTTIPPPESTSVDTTTTLPPITLPTEPIPFLAVGDSVMLGAAPTLTERGMSVDAMVSRQTIDLIPMFEQLRDRGLFGNAVVVQLGTDGPFSQETLDALLATMDDVPNVILMTVKADRSWTAGNNALIRAADHERDNRLLLDWEALSANCPGECFFDDGIHLRPDGQTYYADLITDILGI
jgi:hypothetical protein